MKSSQIASFFSLFFDDSEPSQIPTNDSRDNVAKNDNNRSLKSNKLKFKKP